MTRHTKEITREQYEEVMSRNNKGIIVDDLLKNFYTIDMLCGYGVYSPEVRQEKDGKFIATCLLGDTCD